MAVSVIQGLGPRLDRFGSESGDFEEATVGLMEIDAMKEAEQWRLRSMANDLAPGAGDLEQWGLCLDRCVTAVTAARAVAAGHDAWAMRDVEQASRYLTSDYAVLTARLKAETDRRAAERDGLQAARVAAEEKVRQLEAHAAELQATIATTRTRTAEIEAEIIRTQATDAAATDAPEESAVTA